jgi:enoyl-CoA hydratase/carnithine racemase
MTAHPLVDLAVADGIATLSLNRPEKRNALNGALMQSIAAALDAVRDNASARVVLLRGHGPLFSSGIDHSYLLELFQQAQSVPFKHLHHDLQEVFHRIERMEKPVIAVIHGAAVGMALELALACDFRLATAGSLFGLPEIAFGIIPDVGGTTRLVQAVGPVKAKELILTGKVITAETAHRLGLLTEVAADMTDLEARAARLAALLTAHSPTAVGMAKSLIQQSADLDTRQSFQLEGVVQRVLMAQPDLGERFAAAVQFIKARMADPE